MSTVLHPDPFNAVLLNSPTLPVTPEQKNLIREILEIACSDSAFADKAYRAIEHVLVYGVTKSPSVTSLTPNSAEIGDPSFTLHIHGTNFNSGSVIVFNGFDEPTTLVSATEVTTGVNMSVWAAPAVVPVAVRSSDGVISDPMNFTFTDGIQSLGSKQLKLPFNPQDVNKKIELDRTINLPINPHPSDKTPNKESHKIIDVPAVPGSSIPSSPKDVKK